MAKPTPEAKKLCAYLRARGIKATTEKKVFMRDEDDDISIDIAVPEAQINIEVDGKQHSNDVEQARSDLWRTYYALKRGYFTVRVPNSIVKSPLCNEAADALAKICCESKAQLEDEDAGEEDDEDD